MLRNNKTDYCNHDSSIKNNKGCRISKGKKKTNRKYMTVHEMGDLLGLKKTERYWLVHKGYFKTIDTPCGMRVDIRSFEKWYANQIKYAKVTGEEPGSELKEKSYSPKDIAEILGIEVWQVYDEMKKADVAFVLVDHWKRYPIDVFEAWYQNQTKYRKVKERDNALEDSTMRIPEMAKMLGLSRGAAYHIIKSNSLETVIIGDRRRVVKDSFFAWYRKQNRYHIVDTDLPEPIANETNPEIKKLRFEIYHYDGNKKNIGNATVLTLREAALIAGVTPGTVSKWISNGKIKAMKWGRIVRIPRAEYELWVKNNRNLY